jgi:hypothetical protein
MGMNLVRILGNKAMNKILLTMTAIAMIATTAQAEPRRHDRNRSRSHNYIIERQEAYQVQGVPTSRLIIGKREIDIYRNDLMFEGDHVVGVKGNR